MIRAARWYAFSAGGGISDQSRAPTARGCSPGGSVDGRATSTAASAIDSGIGLRWSGTTAGLTKASADWPPGPRAPVANAISSTPAPTPARRRALDAPDRAAVIGRSLRFGHFTCSDQVPEPNSDTDVDPPRYGRIVTFSIV